MRESKLEIKAKKSKPTLFKKINDYIFKLEAYIIDGIPISKHVSTDNKVVYGKF
jgi:hypothetical protein